MRLDPEEPSISALQNGRSLSIILGCKLSTSILELSITKGLAKLGCGHKLKPLMIGASKLRAGRRLHASGGQVLVGQPLGAQVKIDCLFSVLISLVMCFKPARLPIVNMLD